MDHQLIEIYDIMLTEDIIDAHAEKDGNLIYILITYRDEYKKRQYYLATLG